MSTTGTKMQKVGRQAKSSEKMPFYVRLTDDNYAFIERLSEQESLSKAAVLNKLLRDLQRQ